MNYNRVNRKCQNSFKCFDYFPVCICTVQGPLFCFSRGNNSLLFQMKGFDWGLGTSMLRQRKGKPKILQKFGNMSRQNQKSHT